MGPFCPFFLRPVSQVLRAPSLLYDSARMGPPIWWPLRCNRIWLLVRGAPGHAVAPGILSLVVQYSGVSAISSAVALVFN